jgi:hypothetical protein
MAKRQVILELAYGRELAETAFAAVAEPGRAVEPAGVPKIAGVRIDATFAPAPLPGLHTRSPMEPGYVSGARFDLALEPEQSTYIVRAEVDEAKLDDVVKSAAVVGCFSDPVIQPCLICPGSPPLGSDADVERLLCCAQLRGIGMDGKGVLVAIVDTGVNMAYLNAQGKHPSFDAARSWAPRPGLTPGSLPVGHGTMCAFDVCIAAPKCTLLDIALLQSTATGPTPMSGFLSDAVRAYAHLMAIMAAPMRPGENRSLVVNNSWGMFHPSWDFPVGHPGNYSDNPNHPFNRIVAALERAGADILFAAGNCGADCPDGRCQGVTANAIYGANGHPSVLCVAGVDTQKNRVGYSTQGPGRLARDKPDLAGYTHFSGSGVYSADGGTSAATPVVAGVVAAVRTRRPFAPGNPAVSPAAIRALMRSTAEDLGSAGFDLDHGFGVVNGCELHKRYKPAASWNLCRLFPDLCRPRPIPVDLCRLYPGLCRPLPIPPVPPRPGAEAGAGAGYVTAALDPDVLDAMAADDVLAVLIALGTVGTIASGTTPAAAAAGASGGCGCHGTA